MESKKAINEFPNLFKRNGKIKNHQVKIELEPNAQITQEKGRRIAIQLQKAVNSGIQRLLKDGHIEKINEKKTMYSFSQQ